MWSKDFSHVLVSFVPIHQYNLRTLCLPTDADSKHYYKESVTVTQKRNGLQYNEAKSVECIPEYSRIDGFPGTLKK